MLDGGSALVRCHRKLDESNDFVEVIPAIESKLNPMRTRTTLRMDG